MKIVLYIDSLYLGGAQRVMANIANYLSNRGHRVILIVDREKEFSRDEYNINKNISRIFLNIYNDNRLMSNLMRIVKLRRILKIEKPDVVLSFLCGPNIRMLIASLLLGCKKIVSVRNDPRKEYGYGVIKLFINVLFQYADKVVLQTKDACEYFCKSILNKTEIITNPVNDEFYNVSWAGCCSNNIITIGRLEEQKNQELLIESFSSIAKKNKNIKLIIYGEGSLQDRLTKLVEKKDLTNRVILSGKVINVSQILAEARMFVLSSNYEGLPNALMEAMAVGLPTIATDCPCGGPRMLLDKGNLGILVPCNNREILSNSIDLLLKNKDMAMDFSKKSKFVAKSFRVNIVMEKWESLFMLT